MPNVCRLTGTMTTFSLFSKVEMRLPNDGTELFEKLKAEQRHNIQ
jgi:hypothetical protein